MNNLEEWGEAREKVKKAWKHWKPHFEMLHSESGDKIMAFFLLNDTDIEWELYNNTPDVVAEDFADYMQDAKEELLAKVGFETQEDEQMESGAEKATQRLSNCMREYEKRTGLKLEQLVFNMLFYSEWIALPEEVLEIQYEEEMGKR